MELTSLDTWLKPFLSLAKDLGRFAPRLTAALLVFLVGLVLSRLAAAVARKICVLLKLDAKLENLWLFRPWIKITSPQAPSRTIGRFTFYLLLILFILLTLRILDPELGGAILASLAGLLPRMFSFMLIVFLGALIAMFASVLTQLILARIGMQHPQFWGKIIAWGTFGGAVIISLEQLGIVGRLLSFVVLIVLGAVGLGSALAFGLGCKDMARQFLIELLKGNEKD